MSALNTKLVYEGIVESGQLICETNRELKKTGRSYLNLKESIIKYGLLNPIMIDIREDGKFIVVDGQHRVHICRELGLPIKYIFCPGSWNALISLNNDRRNWQIHDYVKFYSETIPSYARLLSLQKQSKLSYNALHACLKGKEIDAITFKDGKFSLTGEEEIKFEKHFEKIKELGLTREGKNKPVLFKTRVISVLSKLINDQSINGYDHTSFKKKLDSNSILSVNKNKEAEIELLRIYNKGLPKHKKIHSIL